MSKVCIFSIISLNLVFNGLDGLKGLDDQKGDQSLPGSRGFPELSQLLKGEMGDIGNTGNDGFPELSQLLKGEMGDIGNTGNDGFPGRKGERGAEGLIGMEGSNGQKGIQGLPGVAGLKGENGEQGHSGDVGFSGRKGERGEEGDIGMGGSNGQKGIQGLPGLAGLPGEIGEMGHMGNIGFPGRKGERGEKGAIGLEGSQGTPGLRGYPGENGERGHMGNIGFPGRKGERGEEGDIGMEGLNGQKGIKGQAGCIGLSGEPGLQGPPGKCVPHQCIKGEKGSSGQPGLPSISRIHSKRHVHYSYDFVGGIFIVKHSQTPVIPICPDNGMTKLWDGFSFGSAQDLGSAGSCLRRFSAVPHVYCSKDAAKCDNFDQIDHSIWLSSNIEVSSPHSLDQISRCIVCAASSPIITFHSQTVDIPSCPAGWTPLWNGYSFAMHKSGSQIRSQSLMSPGSCLETFAPSVLMECHSTDGTCRLLSNKFNYWLNADENDFVVKTLPKISRCSVCMQGLN